MIYKMKKHKNNFKSWIKPNRAKPRKAKKFFFLYKRRKTNKISWIAPFYSRNKKIKNIKRKKITKICKPTNTLFTLKIDKKKLKYRFLKIKKRKKKKIWFRYKNKKKVRKISFRKRKIWKKPIPWLNIWTNTIYNDTKVGPKDIRTFSNTPWGTGSTLWNFFPQAPYFTKKKLKHILIKCDIIYLEFYPQYYFNLNLHYHKHVPPRYIYNINAMWTPYYILLFYLSKLYRDSTNWTFHLYNSNNLDTDPISTSTYFHKGIVRRILRRKGYLKKNYLPKNAINIILCSIHDTINTSNKIMYKYFRRTIPWWMRAQQRRRIWAWIRRKIKRNKRKMLWAKVKWFKQNKIKKISKHKFKSNYYKFLKQLRQQRRKIKKISKHKYKSNYYKVLKQLRQQRRKIKKISKHKYKSNYDKVLRQQQRKIKKISKHKSYECIKNSQQYKISQRQLTHRKIFIFKKFSSQTHTRLANKKYYYLNRKRFKTWLWNPITWGIELHNKEIYSFIQKFLLKAIHKYKWNRRNWRIADRDDKKKRYIRKYVNKHICLFKRSLIMHKRLSTLQSLLRNAHRFGSHYLTKTFFYDFWMRYILWGVIATAKENKILRVYIPYNARRAQRIAYKYFSISRWNNRSFSWLNPVMYNRKMFPFHVLHLLTRETRHPHRRKRWKVYNWLTNYTLNNKWNYGMRAKKNYRLKQILFGRIVLPALNYLRKKQFFFVKSNTARVKPLAITNCRPGLFIGKFERRLDVLTYKLNFAPTIQWARLFVESGWIYISYWKNYRNCNFVERLKKYQKFPLLFGLKLQTLLYTNTNLDEYYYTRYRYTFFGRQMLDEPLPITLSSYRVMLNGIIHWTSPNIKTWFYRKLIQRKLPKYFIFNRSQTVGYFWRNLMLYDIEKLKGTRIKKNTFTWLL